MSSITSRGLASGQSPRVVVSHSSSPSFLLIGKVYKDRRTQPPVEFASLNGLTCIAQQLRLCNGSFVKRRCARGSNLNEVRNDEEENKKDPGWRVLVVATATVVPHQAVIKRDGKMANNNDTAGRYRAGCLPSKTRQSTKNKNTEDPPSPTRLLPAATRYPPRQPLNLWRCDNVDAAFCMLDCRRIHSRFSPTLARRASIRLPHVSLALALASAFPNAYAGISELYHHRYRNHHHHHRHCHTVVLAAPVIYYLLKLVWPGFIAYVAASEILPEDGGRSRRVIGLGWKGIQAESSCRREECEVSVSANGKWTFTSQEGEHRDRQECRHYGGGSAQASPSIVDA
ncbi:hypothetical protein G5I_06472 [Acromyrmex echinatior]|uniref:Uncharacterized protein n=1 Tax=Acromyrmex echinatior TaxID=103372 RepID=F4WL48_ACREC|nr:hypothetical protein G5I_06472 [Acromyrmex echinatior]